MLTMCLDKISLSSVLCFSISVLNSVNFAMQAFNVFLKMLGLCSLAMSE